ncbi:hypothetical protein, partial [Streptomyces sp. NPDC059744]|uniref:hypothetical protein n=1 Tax=Streptomyces sp. NPDC059744 TaxID=3346929 RepID=UPI00365EEEEB
AGRGLRGVFSRGPGAVVGGGVVGGAPPPPTPVRLITTINHGGADRVRSYELPAEVWQRG